MTYQECFGKGLLRESTISKSAVAGEIRIAEDYLKKAEKLLGSGMPDVSFLMSYVSLFHSARSLLFAKGYKERSHYCLFEFVKREFKDDAELHELVSACQNYREIRSTVQYDGSLCSQETAQEAFKDAKRLLAQVKKKV